MTKKLDTASYKGVRDFYPEDMSLENYIFSIWRKVLESFGYVEYNASILEPSELYKAKTGEEIVNDQTYTFTDRGGREVTLRPEMTPTVARMVAGRRRDLAFPLRWYSIPNLFRYEAPQRGRLREHFQLNADIFGVAGVEADIEIIAIASKLMEAMGAKKTDFEILINSRQIYKDLLDSLNVDEDKRYALSKVIDKKNKVDGNTYRTSIVDLIGESGNTLVDLLDSNQKLIAHLGESNANVQKLITAIERLSDQGVTNVAFTPTIMRGFDYYTDFVFEVFDSNKENRRSLFGGGRYDDLTALFGEDKLPAVGIAAGDVTMQDFMATHGLLPTYKPTVDLYICRLSDEHNKEINELASSLRDNGVRVAIDWSGRKIADQIKSADKQKIPFILCIGEEEVKSKSYKVKELSTGTETTVGESDITKIVRK